MKNANALVGNEKNDNSKWCFTKPGEIYVIYLSRGGTTEIDLNRAQGTFQVKWYDPRNGGPLKGGTSSKVTGGGVRALGNPPSDGGRDWACLLRKTASKAP